MMTPISYPRIHPSLLDPRPATDAKLLGPRGCDDCRSTHPWITFVCIILLSPEPRGGLG